MENFPLIEVAELTQNIVDCDNLGDEFIVTNLDATAQGKERACYEVFSPIRMNAITLIIVSEGSARIEIDYISYTARPNSLFIIIPTHLVQPIDVSPDFKGKMIVASTAFLQSYASEKKPSMTYYMQFKKNPYTALEPEETKHMDIYIDELRKKIRSRTHFFHREVVQVAFVALLLEMGNILAGKTDRIIKPVLSRKEEIFEQFLELLHKYCWQQHNVAFYAEELCITPQYLSVVLKSVSGKAANRWIEDALMAEAKILLKKPNTTVQQVADMLNFPDQSTFGKFFKKNLGLPPSEYRRRE